MPIDAVFNVLIYNADLGTNDTSTLTKIKVYPNPIIDEVYFEAIESIQKITIYNVSGQEVFNSEGDSPKMQINLSSLPAGIYVAKLLTNKGIETIKLSKK